MPTTFAILASLLLGFGLGTSGLSGTLIGAGFFLFYYAIFTLFLQTRNNMVVTHNALMSQIRNKE